MKEMEKKSVNKYDQETDIIFTAFNRRVQLSL